MAEPAHEEARAATCGADPPAAKVLRWSAFALAAPFALAIIAVVAAIYAIGSLVEILVAALEGRRPQLPPATHSDGTPATWRDLLFDRRPPGASY